MAMTKPASSSTPDAAFNGFTDREFEIFALPSFEARMPALKAEITPRLKALGDQLAPALQERLASEIHPHVAQHLRRSVNPPVETWVAFSRSPRAYKPFVHFRVAINGEGVKVVCYLEEDAEDKPVFAEALRRNAGALAGYFRRHPEVRAMDPRGQLSDPAAPSPGDEAALAGLADRLSRLKGQHASFSIPIERADPTVASPQQLAAIALDGILTLAPLYRLGAEPGIVLEDR
jgi:uncharacterized protein YktB (UPF0637 family)